MKILVTGATGFVGSRLLETLITSGHVDLRVLTRNKDSFYKNSEFPVEAFEWNPNKKYIEDGALENVDCIIHLAGEGVADGRWTSAKKERILSSRVNGTRLLMDAIEKSSTTPKKFISASAIGIYGNRNDEWLNSESSLGDDYLADVCKKWEDLCLNHSFEGMKSICLRVGIVLGENGGALKKMLPPFKAGVAGILGSGKQHMSWVHIDDLVGQFIFLVENETKSSIYNGVSPNPVSNLVFTKILGETLGRPTLFPAPVLALKILFGEMSQILLNSQMVSPDNLLKEGYQFKFENLRDALEDILKHSLKGELVLKKYQWVDKNLKDVFQFFSNEKNLEQITPSSLHFKVVKKSTPDLRKGTLIDYKLKVHGIPLKWQSRIESFTELESFVDEQVQGPYTKWHHTHDFIAIGNGTLMRDTVIYKVPFGTLGLIVSGMFVKRDINNIFNFRKMQINKIFS